MWQIARLNKKSLILEGFKLKEKSGQLSILSKIRICL